MDERMDGLATSGCTCVDGRINILYVSTWLLMKRLLQNLAISLSMAIYNKSKKLRNKMA